LIVQRLVAAVERLAMFPNSGRVVPEFGDPVIREVLWRNYRLVYRVLGQNVEIVTVFHGALPLSKKMLLMVIDTRANLLNSASRPQNRSRLHRGIQQQ